MPDQRAVVFQEFDGDDVETAGGVVQNGLALGQETLGDPPDLPTLGGSDRLFGITEGGIGPGFDFDENQRRSLVGDDVDFPTVESIAALDDLESFPFQVADGRLFAAPA